VSELEALRTKVVNQRKRLAQLEQRQAELARALRVIDGESTFTVRRILAQIVDRTKFAAPNSGDAYVHDLALAALDEIKSKIPEWVMV
jgi:hypothetical protein